MFVSHEYCHAFNVKRLRPVELGPFDYERPPRTTGLWVAEGLTTYYGDLCVRRAGLCSADDYLDYTEALAWFGLRFAGAKDGQNTWRLEVPPDATAGQHQRLRAWLGAGR